MKKLMCTFLIGSLFYFTTSTVLASPQSDAKKQVEIAAASSRVLHDNYTHNLDYKTVIGAPYIQARTDITKAKVMVNRLPSSETKTQLLNRTASYQKVVENGNAYNNAVRTFPILENYEINHLDPYFSDFYQNGKNYDYFNYKLSLLQKNYDKVYGKYIQNEFKSRYLAPLKKTRDEVYYVLNAEKDLKLSESAVQKDVNEAERQLNNAEACLKRVSDSSKKELLIERSQLISKFIEDEKTGVYDTFYIAKNDGNYLHRNLQVSFDLKGVPRLWIADAKKFPNYESLKNEEGNRVYGYDSYNWSYRDWSSAYETNIIHTYYADELDYINARNDKLIPPGTEIIVVLEVTKPDGEVVVKEEKFTMTDELYEKAKVKK